MKDQPLVSIVVPIYNVQEYIAECLYSLIRQTYRNIEIICVDDCTLDNSMYIVRQIQRIDSRIKLVTHTENRGLGGARNTGIGVATGKYIMFVDSDDTIEKNMLERLFYVQQQTNADVVGSLLHPQRQFTDVDYQQYTSEECVKNSSLENLTVLHVQNLLENLI